MQNLIRFLFTKFRTIGHYAILAGLCWLLDLCIFLLLVHFTPMPVFWSNIISSIIAATTAYFLISQRIFKTSGGFRWYKWGIYVVFTLVMMFVWSGIIAALVAMGLWPVLAKIVVLPLSFYSNFLFMGWLQEGRVRWH